MAPYLIDPRATEVVDDLICVWMEELALAIVSTSKLNVIQLENRLNLTIVCFQLFLLCFV